MPNTSVTTGEEYRKYLERGGVMEALKRVLVILYEEPEWPINPNEYVCKKLSELCDIPLIEKLKGDLLVMQDQVKNLEQTITHLEDELKKCKSKQDPDGVISSK